MKQIEDKKSFEKSKEQIEQLLNELEETLYKTVIALKEYRVIHGLKGRTYEG